MDTDTVWTITIKSLAPGVHAWQSLFLGKPTRRDIMDALEYEGGRAKQRDGIVNAALVIFADLASHLPVGYAEKAVIGRGYIIYAAQVEIGSVGLRKQEIYKS